MLVSTAWVTISTLQLHILGTTGSLSLSVWIFFQHHSSWPTCRSVSSDMTRFRRELIVEACAAFVEVSNVFLASSLCRASPCSSSISLSSLFSSVSRFLSCIETQYQWVTNSHHTSYACRNRALVFLGQARAERHMHCLPIQSKDYRPNNSHFREIITRTSGLDNSQPP